MQAKARILVILLSAGVLFGQANPPTPPPQEVVKLPSYVRRFSAGGTLTVLGLTLIKGGNQSTSTSTTSTQYSTTGASQRIGYGVTAQLALTDHFAVDAKLLLRKIGYQMTTTVVETTGDTTTINDTHEDTRAQLFDIPVVVRYFSKSRHQRGPRWFIEGGGALRKVRHIRTSTDTTDNDGRTVAVCSPRPHRRTARCEVSSRVLDSS